MPIRVLVVDDSTFIRKALTDILKRDKDIQIVGEARDGEEAIEKVKSLQPDVITLDYEMPKKNGLEVIREVMRIKPTPIVMISSYTKEGAAITLRCLEEGAVDFISKDIEKGTLEVFRKGQEIITKIKNAAKAKVNRNFMIGRPSPTTPTTSPAPGRVTPRTGITPGVRHRPQPTAVPHPTPTHKRAITELPKQLKKVVVIGASTGGPNTVLEIFSMLEPIPAGFVVVIHMPPMFTATYAQRLQERTGFPAKEAETGDRIEPGKILVAPGGVHLRVERGGVVRITPEPRNAIYKPSIDIAMETTAEVFKSDTIGVILTGMGNDGSKGVKKIKEYGGRVIVENEQSAIVFGMPRSAIETGAVDYIEDAHRIPSVLQNLVIGS